MKTIYLLRHFKVKDKVKKRLDSNEYLNWLEHYDNMDLEYKDIVVPEVDKVYVSSLKRAIKTAEYLNLEYEKSNLLKEVASKPFFKTNCRFSKNFWLFISRFLWFFNFEKNESIKDTKKRVNEFLEKINNEKETSILIVSHGLFMKVLISELEKTGYKSKKTFNIKNAEIYKVYK